MIADPSKMTPDERREFARLVQIAGVLPLTFMKCRLLKHSWEPVPVDIDLPFGRPLAFSCERCSSRRYDCYDIRWGTIVYRKYVYADGYLIREEDGGRGVRVPITAVRLAYGKATEHDG